MARKEEHAETASGGGGGGGTPVTTMLHELERMRSAAAVKVEGGSEVSTPGAHDPDTVVQHGVVEWERLALVHKAPDSTLFTTMAHASLTASLLLPVPDTCSHVHGINANANANATNAKIACGLCSLHILDVTRRFPYTRCLCTLRRNLGLNSPPTRGGGVGSLETLSSN